MANLGQKQPIDVRTLLEAARAERGAVEDREVESDPEMETEADLLFALEEILVRAANALREAQHAALAADMPVNLAPDDSQVGALRLHTLACLGACQQWVADAADAVTLSTQRLAARRQAAKLILRFR